MEAKNALAELAQRYPKKPAASPSPSPEKSNEDAQ
jgi:hypothetical protein